MLIPIYKPSAALFFRRWYNYEKKSAKKYRLVYLPGGILIVILFRSWLRLRKI